MPIKIIIIDDEIDSPFEKPFGSYMWYYSEACREAGWEVTEASSVSAAIETLQKNNDFDAVVLDMMIPAGDGLLQGNTCDGLRTCLVLVEYLLKQYPLLPVVILSNVLNHSAIDPIHGLPNVKLILYKASHTPFEFVRELDMLLSNASPSTPKSADYAPKNWGDLSAPTNVVHSLSTTKETILENNIMSKEENRGIVFEHRVRHLLETLKKEHTKLVEVTYQPRLLLHSGEEVIPDFELCYDLGFQKDARLIECQSRNRSSSSIIHKIRHIKSLSSRNRFIFVYEDEDYLSEPTRKSLASDGVSFYSYDEFKTFIKRLDLAMHGIQAASFALYSSDDPLNNFNRAMRMGEAMKRMKLDLGSHPLNGFWKLGRHKPRKE